MVNGGTEQSILMRIKSVFDSSGFKQAKTETQNLGKTAQTAAKQVDSSTKQMSSSFGGLGSAVNTAMGFIGGMVGYELVSGLSEAGQQAINASQQFDYFAGRLGKSKQETEAFRNQVTGLQKDFKKVNMESIGATSMDIALRNGLQGTNEELSEISQMAAVMASEFKRNGRSEEDSVLAVNDALDGQFKRLQEIGITQDALKQNGWNGDLNDKLGLVRALNTTMDKMGYKQTAQDITNLDDAWAALTVSGGNLLKEVLVPMMPAFLAIIDGLTSVVSGFSAMPDWFKNMVSYGIAAAGGLFVMVKAVNALKGSLGGLSGFTGIFGKIFGGLGGEAAGGGGSQAMGQGIVKTLEGLKGFGRALLGLVPDIVMAGAAIAVIIGVVFALAAEVVVLAKGIQLLIDSMKFGDVKLDDDIEGLKKLGEAMKEIANILGAMVIANVANIVTQVTGGVLNLATGLKTIKDSYEKVKKAVDEIKGMGDIDQGGLDKLKKLGEAMKSLGDTAQGLNDINGSLNFGSLVNNMVAFLTGGNADVGANIQTLIDKVRQIAPKLNQLATLPDIDQSGVDKIKKIGDAVKSMGDVMSNISGVQGGFVGGVMDIWQGSFQEQFDKMFDVVQHIGSKLSGLGAFSIPDTSWIQRIGVALSYIKGAMSQLNGYANIQINTATPEVVGRAVTAIKMIAQQLQGLASANIGDVNGLLGQIQQAIEGIKSTLNAANFSTEGTNIGTSLTQGVQSGLSGLPGVVTDASNQAVSAADGTLPPGMGNVASNATNSFRNNLKLADIARSEMDYAVQAINSGSGALAQAAADAARKAVESAKSAAGQHSPGYIAQAWGDEFGKFSPQKINEGTRNLLNAIRTNTTSAVKTAHSAQTMNRSNPALTGAAGGNVYNVGENAFNITVKDMDATEAKNVIVTALESL